MYKLTYKKRCWTVKKYFEGVSTNVIARSQNISRMTVFKLVKEFRESGWDGLKDKRIYLSKEVIFLQLLASFIIAINYLFFKFFAIRLDFWTVSFWQYLSFVIFGIILLIFVKSYRKDFFFHLKKILIQYLV
jgi:biotin operon repressor